MERLPTEDSPPATSLEISVRELVDASEVMKTVVQGLETAMRYRTQAFRWAVVAFSAVALVLGVVLLDNRLRIDAFQRKLCPMVTVIIPRPGDAVPPPGPAGDRGREVIARSTDLAKDFGCANPARSLPRSPSVPSSPDQAKPARSTP